MWSAAFCFKMMQSQSCPNCGSTEIIPRVRVVDHAHRRKMDLGVEIYANPHALLFKGTHMGKLHARICGKCGYTELFVENPREILRVHRFLNGE